LPREIDRLLHGNRSLERLALDVSHHQIVGADVVDLANMGMIQRRDGMGFALETLAESDVTLLDGDDTIQARVARFPHFAHPACPDGCKDFVGAEFRTCGQGHPVWSNLLQTKAHIPSNA
jgi:hypothetical protein